MKRWIVTRLSAARGNYAVAVVGSILVVAGFTTLGVELSNSSATDWIQAIATAAAFAAAVVAARYASAIYQIEERRDVRLEEAATRSQAERVAAWSIFPDRQDWSGNTGVNLGEPLLCVRNATDLPIYGVEITIEHALVLDGKRYTESDYRAFDLVPPGSEPFIETRSAVEFPVSEDLHVKSEAIRSSWSESSVVITFRDAGDRYWQRLADGKLRGPFDKYGT